MIESSPGPTTKEPGALARLTGVLFSPAKTFESIARKPGWDWLVPVVLLMAAIFLYSNVVTPKIDTDGFIRQVEKKLNANPNVPEQAKKDAAARMEKQFAFSKTLPGQLVGPLIFVIPIFLVPAVYFGIAAMFGVRKSYLGIVAAYAYIQIVQVLWWLLATVVSISKDSIDVQDANMFRILKSSPGDFMTFEGANRFLLTIASYVDVFEAVALVLGIIALSKTTRFTMKNSAVAVTTVWCVWVLIVGALGQLSSMFGA